MEERNEAVFPEETVEAAKEVTIKFGKGLVEEPFASKSGKEMVRISIPNREEGDSRPWETFVVPANMVHDNQFGKGVWMKLPEDSTTKLSRSRLIGKVETGKNIWGADSRTVSNKELKSLLEAYKEKNRDSVLSNLSDKKAESVSTHKEAPKRASRGYEAAL